VEILESTTKPPALPPLTLMTSSRIRPKTMLVHGHGLSGRQVKRMWIFSNAPSSRIAHPHDCFPTTFPRDPAQNSSERPAARKSLVTSSRGKVKADAWVVPRAAPHGLPDNPNRKAKFLPQRGNSSCQRRGVEQCTVPMIFQSWVCRGPARAIRLRLIARRQTRLRFRGRTDGDLVTAVRRESW